MKETMTKKKFLITLFVFVAAFYPAAVTSAAGTDVILNDKNGIPDKVLYQEILSLLKSENIIEQSKNEFTKQEAEKLTILSVYGDERSNKKIKTFKGIHYLKNLEYLIVQRSGLTHVKGMEPLPKLKFLDLNRNKLTDIKFVKNFKNLESFFIEDNRVKSLAGIGKLKKLKCLSASYNQLSDIKPLKKCKKLEMLDVKANQIKSLKGIENLSKMYELMIGRNQIKDLKGIEKLTKLKCLDLSSNRLTSLAGIEKLIKLDELDLSRNRLTSLKGIEPLVNLDTLNVSENRLEHVEELAGLKSIRDISVKGNRLSTLPDLRGFDGIYYFNVEFNLLSEQEIRAKFPTALWDKDMSHRVISESVNWFDYQFYFQNIDTFLELTEPSSVKKITKDTKKIAGYVHDKDAYIQFRCDYDHEDEEKVIEVRPDKNGYFEFTDLNLKDWGGRPASICFGKRMDHVKKAKWHYYTESVEKYRFKIKR